MATTLSSVVLFDFTKNKDTRNWMVVNDGVMGGLSEGTFTAGENGNAVFKGTISLENNGGFSSVRCNTGKIDVEGYATLELHLKGDGKKYQVRIQENNSDYFSYIYYFQTSGAWETVQIPLAEMYPSFGAYFFNRKQQSRILSSRTSESGVKTGRITCKN